MAEDWEKLLDDAGWNILDELQRNARVSFAELGRRVGLSTPAMLERVHKMEACGILLGYHAKLDRAKTGMPIAAFIRLSVLGDLFQRVIAIAEKLDEVLECHRVTGTDSFASRWASPRSNICKSCSTNLRRTSRQRPPLFFPLQ